MTCGGCLRLVTFLLLSLLVLGARSVAADVTTCLNETGYAFEDAGTKARLDGAVVYAFPPHYSSCAPPIEGMVDIGADPGGAAPMQFGIGFGSKVSGLPPLVSDDHRNT